MIFSILVTSLLVGSATMGANGAEILDSEITFDKGKIDYRFNARVDLPKETVLGILTDYRYLPRLNKHIKSSAQLSSEARVIRVFKLEKCIVSFCFNLNFGEEIQFELNGIKLRIIKNRSSFHSGSATWRIEEFSKNQSLIFIDGQLEPKFWIPPVIGLYFLDKVFNEQIAATVKNVEKLSPQ